jgi:hypothetical protein
MLTAAKRTIVNNIIEFLKDLIFIPNKILFSNIYIINNSKFKTKQIFLIILVKLFKIDENLFVFSEFSKNIHEKIIDKMIKNLKEIIKRNDKYEKLYDL